jgi:hypothetical protein
MSEDFYAGLAPLTRFAEIAEGRGFARLPDDWHLVLTDVRGSTRAIAEGRYKEVNMVGAASIVALLNAAGPVDIPFVFGGDGATLAVPAALLAPARAVLGALQALARQSFGLELRAGLVPAAELAAAGRTVRVARLAVTPQYAQAIFSGGLALAERLLKDPASAAPYLVPPADDPAGADLAGLECRWRDVPSRHGETVSLLVAPAPGLSDEAVGPVLRDAIAQIEAIYGSDSDYHPLAADLLSLSRDPRRLLAEARARAPGGPRARLAYLARIWLLNLGVGAYRGVEALRGRAPWWDQYRELVVRAADYRKYDDTLRMILAGTAAQREGLETYLDARCRAGELAYGLHVADRAVMTCLVFERMGRQVHFVDGADGGYALAARALKARLAGLAVQGT